MIPDSSPDSPLVSACIATYRRPVGLQRLLQSLEQQELAEPISVEIIVVDNDPPSAEAMVSAHAAVSRFSVHYLTQAEPNISLTRNAGVAAASGEFVWFVDDDEVARPDCLQELLWALEAHSADAVFGPVLPDFESAPPAWLQPLFDRAIHPTGSRSLAYRTGNTLVRRSTLQTVDGPFDPAFGLTGGEDTFFFRQLDNAGFVLIDSAEAIVTETVPAERASWPWLRARMQRQGQNWARQTVTLEGGRLRPGSAVMAGKAIAQVLGWAAAAAWRWRDRTERSRHLLRMWTNVGKLKGMAHRFDR